ncbi:MAG: hypothetical protein ACTSVI_04380, partial [Promethearchaeota archaeon]
MFRKRFSTRFICTIDKAHDEYLDVFDDMYSELFHVIHDELNIEVHSNNEKKITKNAITSSDIFVIGCPSHSIFLPGEIELVLKYVKNGGSLLIVSDAGGDRAYETNLNDLSRKFNIKIEPTMVREKRYNIGSSVAPMLENVNFSHQVMKDVVKLVMGGT